MKNNSLIIAAMALTTLGMVACSNAGDSPDVMEERPASAMSDLRMDKDAVAAELRGLRERIGDRLDELDEKLMREELAEEKRDALAQERQALEEQLLRLEGALEAVEGAMESTWNDVKRSTKEVAHDVGDWFERQVEEVEEVEEVLESEQDDM